MEELDNSYELHELHHVASVPCHAVQGGPLLDDGLWELHNGHELHNVACHAVHGGAQHDGGLGDAELLRVCCPVVLRIITKQQAPRGVFKYWTWYPDGRLHLRLRVLILVLAQPPELSYR